MFAKRFAKAVNLMEVELVFRFLARLRDNQTFRCSLRAMPVEDTSSSTQD